MELIDAAWIRRHLTQRHGELKALADATGLSPDKITKILNGTRQVKATERHGLRSSSPESTQVFRNPQPTIVRRSCPSARRSAT